MKYLKLFTSLAPINSLSEGQLIRLLECYLTDESLFPEKNSKVADAMSVLDIRSLISQITNSFNESKP